MSENVIIQTICDDEWKLAFSELRESFERKYNSTPDFYIRVPGRVNLIGEHIDYCGYSVCPMAIKQSIIVAVKAVDGCDMNLSNVEYDKYKDYSCKIDSIEIATIPNSPPAWCDYILCGFKGILEIASDKPVGGLTLHLKGSIPSGAGLSSSSALVCAGALALSSVLNIRLSKCEIAELTARAEHYIGTQGGGMDQAIIFNAKKGNASYISFNPLKLTDVQIPPDGTFVIAQSMVTKNKAASNDFNSRVVECRLSALMIAKSHLENWREFTVLADVQKELKYDFERMIKIVQDLFHDHCYARDEVCEYLKITIAELEDKFLTKDTKHLDNFKLKQRSLHVLNEAFRVQSFCNICNNSKSLPALGRLMLESHYSLKDLYECSHSQLDQLITCCSANAAFGARLSGAGWGGCIVALVPGDQVDNIVKSVRTAFYADKIATSTNIDELIFVTKPDSGAAVFDKSILN